MSGPYREAFVLLSDVAFEEAKALGEQFVEAIVAVAEKPPEPTRAARLDFYHPDVWIVIVKDVQDRFDWKLIGWQRCSDDDYTFIQVRLACGHKGGFKIASHSLLACVSPRDMMDYILDEIEKPPIRGCKCGELQLGPAGRPS